jgi:5'-deoxy-5'-methylthioadenosine phosphorylase
VTAGALGIIAGTGFYTLAGLDEPREFVADTSYGPARLIQGSMEGRATYFVSRHGIDHSVPPHMVNYRAIMRALADAGVTEILAINVVGGIGHAAGDLVVVEDFIDFTHQRPVTFFDGSTPEGVVHVDMGEPYDVRLRDVWLRGAEDAGVQVTATGVYGAFEGPRFETRAEIRMARDAGVTVVGMTGVPEVVLAAELGIPYASLCLVANPAAGLSPDPITIEDVTAVVAEGSATVTRILTRAAAILARSS